MCEHHHRSELDWGTLGRGHRGAYPNGHEVLTGA